MRMNWVLQGDTSLTGNLGTARKADTSREWVVNLTWRNAIKSEFYLPEIGDRDRLNPQHLLFQCV